MKINITNSLNKKHVEIGLEIENDDNNFEEYIMKRKEDFIRIINDNASHMNMKVQFVSYILLF